MNFLMIFIIFILVLFGLIAWSYFMCPHVMQAIRYWENTIKQYKQAMSDKKKEEDYHNKDTDLEKWY